MSMEQRRRSTRTTRRPPIRNLKESTPTGVSPVLEYSYIQRDVLRVLLMGGGLVLAMVLLAVANVF